jgi:hypothetical protein
VLNVKVCVCVRACVRACLCVDTGNGGVPRLGRRQQDLIVRDLLGVGPVAEGRGEGMITVSGHTASRVCCRHIHHVLQHCCHLQH